MVPYGAIDHVYGFPALDAGDGFTNAQALCNLIEATLNLEYIYLRHTSPRSSRTTGTAAGVKGVRYHGYAPLVGFAASLMTLSKTSLYFFQGELRPRVLDIARGCTNLTDRVLLRLVYGQAQHLV